MGGRSQRPLARWLTSATSKRKQRLRSASTTHAQRGPSRHSPSFARLTSTAVPREKGPSHRVFARGPVSVTSTSRSLKRSKNTKPKMLQNHNKLHKKKKPNQKRKSKQHPKTKNQ